MQSLNVANIGGYLDPASGEWRDVPGTTVEMVPAPLGLQPTDYIIASWQDRPYGEVESLLASSVHDGNRIAIRLDWASARPNTGAGEGFPDAAAIAFPVRGEPELMQMGSEDAPVHFLQWMARKNMVRSVLATGIGLSVTAPSIAETVAAGWSSGRWTVVFTREMSGTSDVSSLSPEKNSQIGFAIWNGANEERAGIKAVSPAWEDLILRA